MLGGEAIVLTVPLSQRCQSPSLGRARTVFPSGGNANIRSLMIVCALLPRFQLTVAAGERATLLQTPVALAPEPGGVGMVGEVSLAAEAYGIHPGMRLGEALARCPRLTLLPPDPAGVADSWERLLVRLESIGAAVEPERPGLVCFDAKGLLRLYGERWPRISSDLRIPHDLRISGVLDAARRALGVSVRFGVAPSRFAAVAAATQARVRRPVIVSGGRQEARAYLAPLPVALLRARPSLADLPEALERLGLRTLGELSALAPAALADRFGRLGLLAHELASGGDSALRPRPARELLREELELPEATSGPQLEQALGLLIDRLLARHERRARTIRAVVLSAVLVERGGTWRDQVVFREALADPTRMRLVLAPRLALIPAPAEVLRLAIERLGPPPRDQRALMEDAAAARRARLREAIRQARAAAGSDAALRVLEVDPESRFPERRAVLTPFE
jgi:protein ImuB